MEVTESSSLPAGSGDGQDGRVSNKRGQDRGASVSMPVSEMRETAAVAMDVEEVNPRTDEQQQRREGQERREERSNGRMEDPEAMGTNNNNDGSNNDNNNDDNNDSVNHHHDEWTNTFGSVRRLVDAFNQGVLMKY